MKCPVCDSRKGKRFCPAKQQLICTQCCGEKRVIEIPCPPDCTFLSSGQSYQRIKQFVAQLQAIEDPHQRQRVIQTSLEFEVLLDNLEKSIVQYASDLRTLDDAQIGAALDTVLETYRTENKGIIYEHKSSNPMAQALAAKLRETIEEYRKESEQPPVGPAEAMDCLNVLKLSLQQYTADQGTQYLNFIRRSHPEIASPGDSGGLISI